MVYISRHFCFLYNLFTDVIFPPVSCSYVLRPRLHRIITHTGPFTHKKTLTVLCSYFMCRLCIILTSANVLINIRKYVNSILICVLFYRFREPNINLNSSLNGLSCSHSYMLRLRLHHILNIEHWHHTRPE